MKIVVIGQVAIPKSSLYSYSYRQIYVYAQDFGCLIYKSSNNVPAVLTYQNVIDIAPVLQINFFNCSILFHDICVPQLIVLAINSSSQGGTVKFVPRVFCCFFKYYPNKDKIFYNFLQVLYLSHKFFLSVLLFFWGSLL